MLRTPNTTNLSLGQIRASRQEKRFAKSLSEITLLINMGKDKGSTFLSTNSIYRDKLGRMVASGKESARLVLAKDIN
jgi:hypothetical protein